MFEIDSDAFQDKDRNWEYISKKCFRLGSDSMEFICNDPVSKELFLDAVDTLMRDGEFSCVVPVVDIKKTMGDLFYHIRLVRELDDGEISDIIVRKTGIE